MTGLPALLLAAAALFVMLRHPACAEPDGRALYQGFAGFAAGPGATRNHLPPGLASCARCHGAEGRGSREGGVSVPPLAWAALTASRGGLQAFADEAIGKAITEGLGRDGRPLSPIMPRYVLQATETEALLAYLRRLGTDEDRPPGVDRNAIRLGTLLPLSGASGGIGRAVLTGLEDSLARVNPSGIHGRRIELRAFDTAAAGAPAAARLLRDAQPYAVIGGLWPSDDNVVGPLLSSSHLGKIGSLMPRPTAEDLDAWDVDLLPPLSAQQATLAADLADRRETPRYGLRIGGLPPAGDGTEIRWFDDVAPLLAALRDEPSAGVVALGLGASAAVMADLPPGWTQDLVVPVPAVLLDGLASGAGGPALWTDLGRAAGRLALELLSRAGRQLSEGSMVAAVADLGGFEPHPGAPVRFTPGRRYAWDATIVVVPASSNRPVHGD